ncbi:hypothetical protein BH24CHL6_BH24CHL6_07210 [soil metagenome]
MSAQTEPQGQRAGVRAWLLAGLAVAVVVVLAAAVWASTEPDGLERVAEDLGFIGAGQEPGFEVLPDYTLPGLDGGASTAVAGIIGIVVVLGVVWLLGRLLARRRG